MHPGKSPKRFQRERDLKKKSKKFHFLFDKLLKVYYKESMKGGEWFQAQS